MTDINHVTLVGRLTRDLGTDERSFGYIANGQARANISIAVNRTRKQGEQWVDEANFFDVTIWGKTAENLKPYLTKGKQIAIDGYLKQDRWEKDGQKFSKVTVVANNVQLLGGKSDNGGSSQSSAGGYTPRFQNNAVPQSEPAPYEGGFGGGDFPEDIPF
ncbi:MAG: single-stranded DNA-binding protein [Treponema sp.]|nr:single-stranded DNA-binding protein [Treponema sp.]